MYKKELNNLDKDELNWLVREFIADESMICELLVEASKSHLSPEEALKEIRNHLKALHFTFYNGDTLKTEIEFKMGKISRSECRQRLGLD